MSVYSGISLRYLKNQQNAMNMTIPVAPVIKRTHPKAAALLNNGIGKFMPKIPATTPKMATTKVGWLSAAAQID